MSASPEEGPRQQIARVCREAAAAVDGVVELRRGQALAARAVGVDPVEVMASAGGYAVTIHMVCVLRPLIPITDAVRREVMRAVERSEFAASLDSVDLHVVDAVEQGGS